DFDRSLLDVPDGASGAFYLKRLARLEEETKSVGRDFQRARQNALSSSDASRPIPAPADSLETQIFAAVLKTERALIDAADLPSATRARYFNAYFDDVCKGVRDATKRFALLQELLETEEAREPVVLSRVLKLRRTLADEPIANVEPSPDGPSVDAMSLEKLLDVPEGESAAFYRERFAALVAARWQVAGLDDARSAALPDAYPNRPQTPKSRRETAESQIFFASRKISSFLADAPELAPAERYYHFRRAVDALGGSDAVERLAAIVARETAREATNPIDKRRAPYARVELARLRAIRLYSDVADAFIKANRRFADDEYWASLPREEQEAFVRLARGETGYPVPPELRDDLTALADEIIDLVETDGLSPSAASSFVDRRLRPLDQETATRVRRAILATLPADARTPAQQTLYQDLSQKIALASLVGSVLPLEGRNLDGTPFDWASYRGAPVLLEILVDGLLAPFDENNPDALAKYEEAGLKVVRYFGGDFETARRLAEEIRQEAARENRNPRVYIGDPNWPIVGALDGVAADADWPARVGLGKTQVLCWVLVDAEGRVLAVKFPSWKNEFVGATTVEKALRALYPNVDAASRPETDQNLPPIPNPWSIKGVY
ncbi:MAG: hypothetical protein IJ991_19465, partial [Thermoguttaceae bacterium]|nr:hypothetical protein [Thermoguttaceae bacterium]